jgi:hypothetical protein
MRIPIHKIYLTPQELLDLQELGDTLKPELLAKLDRDVEALAMIDEEFEAETEERAVLRNGLLVVKRVRKAAPDLCDDDVLPEYKYDSLEECERSERHGDKRSKGGFCYLCHRR